MSIRIAEIPRKEIFDYVYAKADEYKYLQRSRPDNTTFMELLGKDRAVGGRLQEYMEAAQVKTYIKDTILNRYAKDRKALPRGVEDLLQQTYGEYLLEVEYWQQDHVSLHRVENGNRLVVVSRTSDLKWETGLRKLIQYAATIMDKATQPRLFSEQGRPDLVLIIFQHGNLVNDADRHLTEKSLELINVKCLWG